MDITFRTETARFNYRVCGIILHADKLLAMKDERSPYYYLPGGRVEMGERAEDAVLREIREELGIDAVILHPLWVNQVFFTEYTSGEQYHELCICFPLAGCGFSGERVPLSCLHPEEDMPSPGNAGAAVRV